ncbi:hypothetical protein [Haliangium ochraceum]|uniref:Uncharacterized protein n=1 Tax=Haliangium ochraceum (strain DSM 14365 / JCM 11303 / SMP-2) TaxID=502025 RepID=D0LTD8_HALO1|nr:hypothetical protein [Haliangium ochraceum]ACY13833.1 hypothetical protein Hoch_1273 [Haliangium ochraceum DSM 14365]
MNYPQISFQVRITSADTLPQMAARVGKALGCEFAPHFDQMYDSGEAYGSSVLGLQIVISHDPMEPEGQARTYVLIGSLRGDIEAQWDIEVQRISISEYILGVLKLCEHESWYIADTAELKAEAGLSS